MLFRQTLPAVVLSALMLLATSGASLAESGHRASHAAGKTLTKLSASPSTRAYAEAMTRMHRAMHTPLSGDVDVDFVRQMIPHHQGAVDMASIQLRYGRDEQLKVLSRWIIMVQELEIGFMQQWLRRRDNGVHVASAKDYYGDAMATMHHAMMTSYTGDADVDFLRGMIPHHRGAVDMTAILLVDGLDPELKKLADDIFRSQTYEMKVMRDMLENYKGR